MQMSETKPVAESRVHIDGLTSAHVALLKQVSDEAAEKAVRRFALTMGLDPDEPLETQSDLAWVRATRKRDEKIWSKIVLVIVGVLAVGATSAFWLGFQSLINRPGPHQ